MGTCKAPTFVSQAGHASHPGRRYGELNQDYVVVMTVFSDTEIQQGKSQCYIAAVLDGHGLLGEKSAELTGNAVVQELQRVIALKDSLADLSESYIERMFQDAFNHAHSAALEVYCEPPPEYTYPGPSRKETYKFKGGNGDSPTYISASGSERLLECGTTCTVAVLQGSFLLIANAGDSSAVLGREVSSGSYDGDELTVRHWSKDPEEAERLRVMHCQAVDISKADGYIIVKSGKWLGYQLSMTRALGHKMLAECGVISTPSVARCVLQPDHYCLILATDGVWDNFRPGEAVRFVMEIIEQGGDAKLAAERLVEQAISLGESGPDSDADNATAAVFVFDTA